MSNIPVAHAEEKKYYAPHVFIVRIWHEPCEISGAPKLWRGVVEHTETNESVYFTDMKKLTDFVSAHANISESHYPSQGLRSFVARIWSKITGQPMNREDEKVGRKR